MNCVCEINARAFGGMWIDFPFVPALRHFSVDAIDVPREPAAEVAFAHRGGTNGGGLTVECAWHGTARLLAVARAIVVCDLLLFGRRLRRGLGFYFLFLAGNGDRIQVDGFGL